MPEATPDVAAQPPQTPAAPEPRGPAGSALDVDGLVAKFFGDDDATPAPASPEQEAETHQPKADTPAGQQEPAADVADTPDGLDEGEVPEVDDGEIDEDEETLTDEDAEVEALLAADEESDEEEDTSKEESFLPAFDKSKFLKEHPELEAPYKHMQAAFSRKMAEVANVRKESEAVRDKATAMERQFLEFQDYLKNDETFEEFLVQVSLNRPQVMDRAYERALALNEDEGKKKEYLKDRELTETKQKLKEKEEHEAQQRAQQRAVQVMDFTKRVASKLGLVGDGDLEVAEQYVANQILQNAADNGRRDISNEQIVAAVKRAAKALAREKENTRRATRQQVQRKQLEAAKRRATEPARPAPARSGAPAARPAAPQRIDNRPKKAPLDSWIDEKLGVEA